MNAKSEHWLGVKRPWAAAGAVLRMESNGRVVERPLRALPSMQFSFLEEPAASEIDKTSS
jgi:hypothetical protein